MQGTQIKRQKWLIWVSAGLVFFLGFESAGLQLALLRVATEFRLPPAMMGVFTAAQYVSMLIVQPVFGLASDKLGKKRITVGAVAVFVTGCLLAAASRAPLLFMAGVFLAGAGYSLTESMCSAALSDAFPQKAEQYMNLSQSLYGAGAVLSPILTSWLITNYGFTWRIAFVLAACGAAALAAPLLLTPFVRPAGAPGAKGGPAQTGVGGGGLCVFLGAPFLLLMLSIFLYGGMETATASFSDSLFAVGLGAPETGAYALSLFWLAIMLSRILFSFVAADAKKMLLWGNAFIAAGLVALALSQVVWLSLLAVGVIGFAMGPLWAMLVALAAREYPSRSGTAVTLMSAASGSGAAVLPLLVGAAVGRIGVGPAYWLVAAAAALSIVVVLYYSRASRRKTLL